MNQPINQSLLGAWLKDEQNLPCYEYKGDLAAGDPWFLLGNYRLTMFQDISGRYQLLSGERGWGRLNQRSADLAGNGASLSIKGAQGEQHFSLLDDTSWGQNALGRKVFGTGYAHFTYKLADHFECKRIISVHPSMDIHEGIPAFVTTVKFRNHGYEDLHIRYGEWVLANYTMISQQHADEQNKVVTYRNQIQRDETGNLLIATPVFQSKDPLITGNTETANLYDVSPPSIYLYASESLDPDCCVRLDHVPIHEHCDQLHASIELNIKAGEERTFEFITGFSYTHSEAGILADCIKLDEEKMEKPLVDGEEGQFVSEALYRTHWKSVLPSFDNEDHLDFSLEMPWNAYVLEAMATYSQYYRETFVPQGMSYDYEWGIPCAARDHLQHALPLMYYNSALAKSCLRYVMKKLTTEGELKYMDIGYGLTSNKAWSVSDQQLFLFMAIGEYLRITQDYSFLNELSEFYPFEAGHKGTTLEKMVRAFTYLRDEVSTGPHGLIRLMNSDWNDMVFYEHSSMLYFGSAESHMNTVMAIRVLPDLVHQLRIASQKEVCSEQAEVIHRLSESMTAFTERRQAAFFQDLGDRTFSGRLYLNPSLPMGFDTMFLEPQSFLLQLDEFPPERKKMLLEEIKHRLMKGEILGARQREEAEKGFFEAGTGENGGFWYALQGPMILGVASFDMDYAWELLHRMTFHHFASRVQNQYAGQWSAADHFNSSLSVNPGTTGAVIPLYCAHPHAWPLYCYLKLKEQMQLVGGADFDHSVFPL